MTVEQKAMQLAHTLVGEDQNTQPLIEVLIDMAKWQREQIAKNDKTLDYYTFVNGEKLFAQYILEMIGKGWHMEAIKFACKDKIMDKQTMKVKRRVSYE